jgi:hypothetical protein
MANGIKPTDFPAIAGGLTGTEELYTQTGGVNGKFTVQDIWDEMYVIVEDEDERDTLFTSPNDLQQVYNKRTNEIETYYAQFGLWLSASKKVFVNLTNAGSPLIKGRICYIQDSLSVGGVRYASINAPIDAVTRNATIGVVVQEGNAINFLANWYAVATEGIHLIECVGVIAAGDFVSARISDGDPQTKIGIAETGGGQRGRMGVAVDDAGIPTANFVWAKISLTAESN